MLFFISPEAGREFHQLIVGRNRPRLAALTMCMEELERLSPDDPDVKVALKCGRIAVELERGFQSWFD
ncbi:MAG TPA: hypothetical protein VGN17_01905 [Bryobacteraceae bacterium]|jgi:hypothetical protein